jgi:hypothetical protein
MKKLLLGFACLFGIVYSSYAQYPIPSYNVPVNPTAAFIDQTITPALTKDAPMEKRRVGVQASHTSPDSTSNRVTVYVFRVDKSIILGPYYLNGDYPLYVDIDGQEWGVLVQAEHKVDVSVWIESYASILKPSRDIGLPSLYLGHLSMLMNDTNKITLIKNS